MKTFGRKTIYVYEINGQEKLSVTSEEEAKHWDQVFAAAERIDQLMQDQPPDVKLDERQRADLSLYLAEHQQELVRLLDERPANDGPINVADTVLRKSSTAEKTEEPKPSMRKQPFVQEFKRPVPPSKDGFSL